MQENNQRKGKVYMEIINFILNIVVILLIFLVGLFTKNYLPSYMDKKGENLATKEDIKEITRKTEEVQREFKEEFEAFSSDMKFKYDFFYRQYSELYCKLYAIVIQSEYVRHFIQITDGRIITFDEAPFLEISPTHRETTIWNIGGEKGSSVSKKTESIETPISKFNKKELCDYIIQNGDLASQNLLKLAVSYRFASDHYSGNGSGGNVDVKEKADVVNRYIDHDGYKLVVSDTIGDKNFYKCISTRIGVQGEVKNIIFAAKYKPEIVFDDALNNDIRITKNENQCLIYNRPIPPTGVMWNDLVDWYAEEKNIDENREIVFIKRLCECLDTSFKAQGAKSGPETWMLQAYYNLKKELGKDLPALIPQVYLYYDPQTLKQRGYKLFEHQKMDFLMVFSHKDRVVIEIDGRQHYAEGNSASPRLYSEMVRAQREMTLFGYDVYRFGGYEFVGADSDEKKKEAVLDDLKQFFLRLFSKYSAL